jgi:predicted HAD superfamily Cof-like phosphohydrolase
MRQKMQSDVRIFMEACGQDVQNRPGFTDDNYKQAVLYLNLIREEMAELEEGFENRDIVETADACGDLIWVIFGLCNTLGIPMNPVWQEITSSNMSKTVEGKVVRRDDGKILKPDTYFPPNIHRALQLQEPNHE